MNEKIEIGDYEIQWVDIDNIMITYNGSLRTQYRYICGGDMESFLSALFGVERSKNNERRT